MPNPVFFKLYSVIFFKQSQNQLSDKALFIPSYLFLKMDCYLLTMVTIFRPDEMLAMLWDLSLSALRFLSWLLSSIVSGCIFPSFIPRSSVLPSARTVLFWKAFRILLTGCQCLISFARCYLPVGIQLGELEIVTSLSPYFEKKSLIKFYD